ncbi:SDR family oxidoreductase [uncultured Clostridium sp.]|uniref:SDR family oxidoreductase n=1 Tax=uncultured Clostridium sp. TaxID=59620 RepID=UPI0028E87624|nr:SDR family oxidoreductase [uncultured Clostridium sp.]
MKIAVFGATGGIGKFIVKHALAQGYSVNAYVRNADKLKTVDKNLNVYIGQISDYNKIKEAIAGCDAVIAALGISMKWGYEDRSSIEAHNNIIKAMKELNVTRLIDWSTPSIKFKNDKPSLATIMPGIMASVLLPKAKKVLLEVNKQVINSNLDWTIVRFMAPKDSPFTKKIKVSFGDVKLNFNISREDIAYFMVNQLKNNEYIHSMPIIGS